MLPVPPLSITICWGRREYHTKTRKLTNAVDKSAGREKLEGNKNAKDTEVYHKKLSAYLISGEPHPGPGF